MTLELDHVTTYADVDDLGSHLARYRAAGFVVDEQLLAHANGVHAGVVRFGADYVEILAVADFDEFDRSAPTNDKLVYLGARPFGIGLRANALAPVHAAWAARRIVVPDPVTIHPLDVHTGAHRDIRLLQLPLTLLRGASCFVVERAPSGARVVAPNGTYALAGITLVSDEADQRARQWRELLAPGEPAAPAIRLGTHEVVWSTPEAFRARFGRAWQPARHPLGELAVVHLRSVDLARTAQVLDGHAITSRPSDDTLLAELDPRDGLLFAITAAT